MGSEPNTYIALVMKSTYCNYITLELMYTEGTKVFTLCKLNHKKGYQDHYSYILTV